MLTINKERIYSGDIAIWLDEYIPFTIEFIEIEASTPIYWRCGDGKLSLVEVGFDRNSWIISSITLTSIDSRNIFVTDQSLETGVQETQGIPVLDSHLLDNIIHTKSYSGHFIDDFDSDVQLLIGKDYASLVLNSVEKPSKFIRTKNIRFGISSQFSLVVVEICGLTQQEVEILKKHLDP